MKKTRLSLALAAATVAFSSASYATNGVNMIGVGSQSVALGGAGVAAFFGAENVIINPALIGKGEGTEFTFGGTLFAPDVSTRNNTASSVQNKFSEDTSGFAIPPAEDASGKSDGDLFVIPSVAFSTRIDENTSFGIGMFGTSGMGADYRTNDGLFNGSSSLQILRFVPTLAFNNSKGGIGFSPIIQYGTLDINYRTNANQLQELTGTPADGNENQVGEGVRSDLQFGYTIGAYFNLTPSLTFAAAYQSSIEMDYPGQLSGAGDGLDTEDHDLQFGDTLEQPSEIKVGVAYQTEKYVATVDYKRLGYGDAKGYSDFGWENQDVYSVGFQRKFSNGSWLGAGYNYGKSPITEQPGATRAEYEGAATNFFNNTFFPATVEKHFTFGGGFMISKNASLEGAFVYTPEEVTTFDTSGVSQEFAYQGAKSFGYDESGADALSNDIESESTTKHSQMAITMQMKYHFE